jgi:type III secretory pathway lipoprotein EscJ
VHVARHQREEELRLDLEHVVRRREAREPPDDAMDAAAEEASVAAPELAPSERSLESVAGVLSARVHLAVARRDPLAGAAELAKPTASVLLTYRGSAPPISEQDVRRLVAGAVQEMTPESVSVVQAHAELDRSGDDALARFGPFTTSASALPKLRLLLGGAAALNIVLVAAVLALWSRHRGVRRSLPTARGDVPL